MIEYLRVAAGKSFESKQDAQARLEKKQYEAYEEMYKKYKEDMKKAAGKGKAKKPDNPEEYARLKKEYEEWRLSKWRGWQSLIKKKN